MRRTRDAGLLALLLAVLSCAGAAAQTASATAGGPGETLSEVRIHGNTATPDADVLRLAGLAIGQPLDEDAIRVAAAKLRASGRFESVDIRKRYRSLTETGAVALVIVVQEHPGQDAGPLPVPGPVGRLLNNGMFLPILGYTDGYSFSYGGRFAFPDAAGRGSRVSVPLTWGGTKRAAIEVERPMAHGPLQRLLGGASIWRRTNPFYEEDEDRQEAWIGGIRELLPGLRGEVRGRTARVVFGSLVDRVGEIGAELTYDTRLDPVFPRNAVLLAGGWDLVAPRGRSAVNRLHTDLRGFLGLAGQSVLSLRLQYAQSDGPLPLYDRYLVGGASTLRGYRPGSFSGDNMAAATAEVRIPLSSPISVGKMGVTLFADAATAYNHGERISDARFRYGTGGGVFLLISVFQLNADLGFREGLGTRFHLSTGLQF